MRVEPSESSEATYYSAQSAFSEFRYHNPSFHLPPSDPVARDWADWVSEVLDSPTFIVDKTTFIERTCSLVSFCSLSSEDSFDFDDKEPDNFTAHYFESIV